MIFINYYGKRMELICSKYGEKDHCCCEDVDCLRDFTLDIPEHVKHVYSHKEYETYCQNIISFRDGRWPEHIEECVARCDCLCGCLGEHGEDDIKCFCINCSQNEMICEPCKNFKRKNAECLN